MTSPAKQRPGGLRGSFAGRLLAAQALVLVAGAVTTWVVATVVGPSIFHDHLVRAGLGHSPEEAGHIEEAFVSSLLIALGVASLLAVGAALVVSWYFGIRVRRSIRPVTRAAAQISAGSYDARVPDPGLGEEFTDLAHGFNALAERLGATETTRRRMLADLAHEMRTPLATIGAHLEAVEDGVREMDDGTMEVLNSSTQRLRRLAEDIAAVSAAEELTLPLRRRRVEVSSLLTETVDAFSERYAARDVNLVLDPRSDELGGATVWVDRDRIGQVLTNLLDNALRHTPPGGEVTLTSRYEIDQWVVQVRDTGEGIAAEHLDHLFDRFYRIDPSRTRGSGGSGIGLAIARAIVRAHGGSIRATSPGPGQGTSVTFRVPVHHSSPD